MLGPQGHSASVLPIGDVMPRRPRSRTTTDGSDACAPNDFAVEGAHDDAQACTTGEA